MANLSDEVAGWILRSSDGARVDDVAVLSGGQGAATVAVRLLAPSGLAREVVVKEYPAGSVHGEREWAALRYAWRIPISTPEPIAYAAAGEVAAGPCLLMSRLPGRPAMYADDMEVRSLARSFAALHDNDASDAGGLLRRPHLTVDWAPRDHSDIPVLVRARAAVEEQLQDALRGPTAFLHSDPNPGNLSWLQGELTGQVDWAASRVGPSAYDVSYVRAEFSLLGGLELSDALGAAYISETGPVHALPVFDLVCGLNAWDWCGTWTGAYAAHGRPDLTEPVMRRQLLEFLADALVRA